MSPLCYSLQGCPEYRELFSYVLTNLNKYNLAYVHVMDGLAFGYHNQGAEPFTLDDVRKAYHGNVIGNCGYTKETAEVALQSGKADAIAFGRDFLANPDLVERFAQGWPLSPMLPMALWYGSEADPDVRTGYVDQPAYKAA